MHNYNNYSLRPKNQNLYDLFFDQVEFINGEVKFKPVSTSLTNEEINELENRLKEIITFLHHSLIFYLNKVSGPDSIGNHGWSHERKKLEIKVPPKCDCLSCKLNRLELSNVIVQANNLAVNEITKIQSDLRLAYIHYKIGNFNQSLKLFEEVANKAWQQGKYFSYYIAKHNRKTLRNLFDFYETNLTDQERKIIIKDLDDIDLDKLLFQIPFIGDSEYRLLKHIRDDDDVLNKTEKELNDLYEKILDYYNKYKNGRSWNIAGSYYPGLVELELNKIISFYSGNYIVIDEFTNFTSICKKAIEALLISFATHDDYKEKLKEFDKLFFDVVIFYGNPEETKAIIEKYEIDTIIFNEEDLRDIINSVNNFLKSFFRINRFWGKADPNNVSQNQTNNFFFGNKCRQIFSNIFLLLSIVELNETISHDLIKNILAFVENENFLYWNNIKYLTDFIYKNYRLFSKENLESLLKSTLHKLENYNQENKLINVIAFVLQENKLPKISDRDLIFNIYNLDKELGKNRYTIIDLWLLSDENVQKELRNKIDEMLSTTFDNDLYVKAALNNIIDYNKYFDHYIQTVNKTKGSNYTLIVGKPAEYSHIFMNAIFFVYQMKIDSNDQRLNLFTNLSDYMQFYLSPETFDYTKFKTEWLYMSHDWNVFHERFAKILAIKEAIEKQLREKFEEELAKIYTKYYV